MTRSVTDSVPLGVRLSSGMALLLVLSIPTLALSFSAAGTGVLSGDVAATRFVQTHAPSQLSWLYDAVNWVGTTGGAALLTAIIGSVLLLLRKPLLAGLVLLTFPLRALNALLKAVLESPRPPEALVSVTEYAHGFGFPSGHAMGAMVLYGTLFILAPYLTENRPVRLTIQAAALLMIALAGISRIYVGAHWPSDVIGAFLWGAMVLVAISLVARRWLRVPADGIP